MRISNWSSDVCSSYLSGAGRAMTVDTATSFGRARDEIDIIDRELQAAFDRIIDAVERVMDIAETLGPERSAGIGAAVAEILEASIVRAIAGQRPTAVRVALERRVAGEGKAGRSGIEAWCA